MELPAIPETEAKQEQNMNGNMGEGESLVTAREREALGRVCWLLHEAGTLALRATFDSIHPPLYLPDHLQHMHVKTLLQRLHHQQVFSDVQWRQLYPPRKRRRKFNVTSQKFDTKVLVVLLQTCCHLCPPYPYGWQDTPLPTDNSLSADIVRLQLKLQEVGALGGLRKEEFPIVWQQVVDLLSKLGNQEVRVKLQRIEKETLPVDLASKYIALIKQAWAPAESQAMMSKLQELERQKRRTASGSRSGYKRKDGALDGGIPPEDKVVINQMYKVLSDNVQAEDVLDRLQQGQVIKVNDRQEVMAPSKNVDRMHVLLPKILKSPIPYAFKLLCDALKFKNAKIYSQLMSTRKAVYKQGVSVTMDIAGITQEGLETTYKEMFSEFSPLSWSEETCCIKDVFGHVELVNSDGKKAPLSGVFPAQTGRSRGPRILIEGSPGCGKSMFASMLAYLWATSPHTFENRYKLLIYLDAQAISSHLADEVYEQLFPPSIKASKSEVWSLLEDNPKDILFLVDGFEGGQGGAHLTKIIQGSLFSSSAVVALVRPEARVDGFVRPDAKLYLLGIRPTSVASSLRGYAKLLLEHDHDDGADITPRGGASSEGGGGDISLVESTSPHLNVDFEPPENYPLRDRLASPFILSSTVAVTAILGKAALEGVSTLTGLCEKLLLALATSYVRQRPFPVSSLAGEATPATGITSVTGTAAPAEVDSEGNVVSFPEDLTIAVSRLETLAFHTLTSRQLAFTDTELNALTEDDEIVTQVGALHKAGPSQRWKFSCSLLRDFFAARFLADLEPATLVDNIEKYALLRSPRTAYVVAFACGLYRGDRSSPTLTALFQQLALNNERRNKRGVGFAIQNDGHNKGKKDVVGARNDNPSTTAKPVINGYVPPANGGIKYSNTKGPGNRPSNDTLSGDTSDQAERNCHKNSSNIELYSHSLLSLTECEGRADLVTALIPGFPRCLQAGKDKGLLSNELVTGLSFLLRPLATEDGATTSEKSDTVVVADVTLNNLHTRQVETWNMLASVLGTCGTLRSLTVHWSCAEMMAEFLHTCLKQSPKNLTSVRVVDKSSGGVKVDHDAATWANIRGFCSQLSPFVRDFFFLGSRAASVTCHVVQSIPSTLTLIDLSGSAFNMMCAAQLGEAMEVARNTATLRLAGVKLPGPAMAALMQGLKRCCCIKHLGLASVHLDRSAAYNLSEFVKLTSSLRVLDLSKCQLTLEMTEMLADGVSQARSLKRLVLEDTVLPMEGQAALEAAAGDNLVLEGLELLSDVMSVRTI